MYAMGFVSVQGAIMTVRRLDDATWNMRKKRCGEMLEARKKIEQRRCYRDIRRSGYYPLEEK